MSEMLSPLRCTYVVLIAVGLLKALPASDISEEALQEAHGVITDAVDKGDVAGATILVQLDGKRVCENSFGCRDLDDQSPMQTDSIVRIYSMTKPITSVAAMTLFEAGKFKLDDPVGKYIPSFNHTKVISDEGGQRTEVPADRPITVRDLFRHTSGYSYAPTNPPDLRDAYVKAGMTYHPPISMMPPRMTITEAADALAGVPAHHHPGARFTYGLNTDILGRLIEIWSEEPLDHYMKSAVLDPLEMNDTGFVVSASNADRFASCHTIRDGKLIVADKCSDSPFTRGFEFLSGGGGLVSTASDYANFCQMLVDGGKFKQRQIIQPETVELMFTNQLEEAEGDFAFGLGFAIADVKVGSGEKTRTVKEYSWGGYASTDFRIVPEERLIQIVLRQRVPSDHSIAGKVFPIIYGGLK